MPLATASANYMLNQWSANEAAYASLHTAYSSTGTNELTGGSPAYARQAITWSSASGGSSSIASTYTFNVPASTTVEYIGFWTAVSGGTFLGMFPNAAGANAYECAVPASTSVFLAPSSGYSANQTVVLFNSPGSTFPGNITQGTVYYIKAPSTDTFELAATSGGAQIIISSDGTAIVQYIAVEVYASQGTFVLNSGSVSIT